MSTSCDMALEDLLARDIHDNDFNKKNRQNFELLLNDERAFTLTSFLGAGNSVPLGIESWLGLVEGLKQIAKESFGDEVIKSLDIKDLPVLADELYKLFESKGIAQKFDEEVSRNIEPKNNSTTLTLVKLALLTKVHLTTNFDISMNSAYEFLDFVRSYFKVQLSFKPVMEYSIPTLPTYLDIINKPCQHIFYLHGKKGGKYLLRSREYDHFYPSEKNGGEYNKNIEECLKSFLLRTSFLFIGFSFQDERLKKMLFSLIAEINRDQIIANRFLSSQSDQDFGEKIPKHFLIAHNEEIIFGDRSRADFFSEFEHYKIYPVIYKEKQHIFLEYLFDKMTDPKV